MPCKPAQGDLGLSMSHSPLLRERSYDAQPFFSTQRSCKTSRRTAAPLPRAKKRETGSSSMKQKSGTPKQGRPDPPSFAEQFYFNVTGFPFPLGPLLRRPTLRTEVISLA